VNCDVVSYDANFRYRDVGLYFIAVGKSFHLDFMTDSKSPAALCVTIEIRLVNTD
jgi:hypothetical protein